GGVAAAGALEQLMISRVALPDDQSSLVPILADKVPSVENGLWKSFPDGRMETTWHLRPGITWHDGTPFTANDLVFTAMVERDKAVPMTRIRFYDYIASIEAPDPQTLVLGWNKPYIFADSS